MGTVIETIETIEIERLIKELPPDDDATWMGLLICHPRFQIIRKKVKLKASTMMLLIYLCRKAFKHGNPFKLLDKAIIDELNMSRATLRRHRNQLKDKGLISVKSGQGNSNTEYTIL